MKNFLCVAVLLAAMPLLPACEDDPTTPAPTPTDDPSRLLPLTSREAVLNNIEYSYNNRQITYIDQLLDTDFIFYFAPEDVHGSIPPEWGRTDELYATQNMFASADQPVPSGPVISSMRVDIEFEDGVEWTSIIPGDYPNETWYSAEVPYSFTIEILPDMTFISQLGTTGQFTVRDVGSEDEAHWQLIEWRDRRATRFNLLAFEVTPNTWGLIKALYQ